MKTQATGHGKAFTSANSEDQIASVKYKYFHIWMCYFYLAYGADEI